MFLKWMVRSDSRGVDFGLWRTIPPSALYLPLDVHTGNTGRALGLLTRRQNDWKAVEEITGSLRRLDPDDPVRYDFALFGVGVNRSSDELPPTGAKNPLIPRCAPGSQNNKGFSLRRSPPFDPDMPRHLPGVFDRRLDIDAALPADTDSRSAVHRHNIRPLRPESSRRAIIRS